MHLIFTFNWIIMFAITKEYNCKLLVYIIEWINEIPWNKNKYLNFTEHKIAYLILI